MKTYRTIFIDLDRTLWDFEANARDTLEEIFNYHDLNKFIESFETFLQTYQKINFDLWEQYRAGKINKAFLSKERFSKTLLSFGLNGSTGELMANQYLEWSPLKKKVFPGVFETLDYLFPKYQLHILTNGFNEVQFKKVELSGFGPYFQKIITSDDAGYKKPRREFFDYAFAQTNADPRGSLMIGDDEEVDIKGAQDSGMDQVFVNYDQRKVLDLKPTYSIYRFNELCNIL